VTLHAARPFLIGAAVLLALGIAMYLGRARLRGPLAGVALRIAAARAAVGERRLHAAGQAALALWFAYWAVATLSTLARQAAPLGQDIRIYYRATQLWLHGGDPWTATVHVGAHQFAYAGSPATTIILAPSALLSENQFTALWIALTAACALLIVRRLRLPLWWLLFAPTVEAVWSGNPQVVVLAIYVVLASLGVAAPIFAVLFLGDRSDAVLDGWKAWLTRNNTAMMAVIYLFFGVYLIGKNLGVA